MCERERLHARLCVLRCGVNGCVYVYSIDVSICCICVCEHIRSTHSVYLCMDVCMGIDICIFVDVYIVYWCVYGVCGEWVYVYSIDICVFVCYIWVCV